MQRAGPAGWLLWACGGRVWVWRSRVERGWGWHYRCRRSSSYIGLFCLIPRSIMDLSARLAVLGGMLSTGIAGAAFALLRERTGNLAGPILAHWTVDGLMVAALWHRRPQPLEPKPQPTLRRGGYEG